MASISNAQDTQQQAHQLYLLRASGGILEEDGLRLSIQALVDRRTGGGFICAETLGLNTTNGKTL